MSSPLIAAIPAPPAHRRVPAWRIFSVLTIVLWGIWGAVSKVVSDQINPYTNQVLFTIGLVPLILVILHSTRLAGGRDRKRGILWAFLTGILGGAGNIAFFKSLGLGGEASVVVPATALFPLVTIILAFFVLHERMSHSQKAGLVVALAAIYLLST